MNADASYIAFYGSAIGGVVGYALAYLFVVRKHGLSTRQLADIVAPSVAWGLMLGRIGCLLNGEQMQKAQTGELIFPVPALVAYLSSVLPLLPGDLIFTGTPSGIGWGLTPQRFLRPGDQLLSYVEGIGAMHHQFAPAAH